MTNRWGFGKTDITPEPGLELEGFLSPYRIGERTISPLYARCAVCTSDGEESMSLRESTFFAGEVKKLVLLVLDLIGISLPFAERARKAVAAAVGTPPEAVMISCTHTHSGPLTGIAEAREGSVRYPELYTAYLDGLEKKLVSLASECAASAVPAALYAGFGRTNISSNRHARISGAKKPVSDRNLRVLRVAGEDGATLGIMVQAAAHPVMYGSDSRAYCSEWPGEFCRRMDEKSGTAIYIQGGCGDLSPLRLGNGPQACSELLAGRLEGDVAGLEASARTAVSGRIYAAGGLFPIPRSAHTPEVCAAVENQSEQLSASKLPHERQFSEYLKYYLEKARKYTAQRKIPPLMAPLQLLMLPGGLPLFALPFEVFSPISVSLAGLADNRAVVAGYANGDMGYLPTAKAMREGGYESDTAPLLYGMYGTWAPSAATKVRGYMKDMLEMLRKY